MSEQKRLGLSDMMITRVGIGTAPIGSGYDWHVNWGEQSEDDAIKAIRTAVSAGVNWVDTAPFYGWGRSERIVGKAIQGTRDGVYIFTKCGTKQDGRGGFYEDLKPESIRREVEDSLDRLQTDHLDLLQFHDPDPQTPIEESWGEVQALIDAGKVRYGGLSNHPVSLIQRAEKIGPVTSIQAQYNPLERSIEKDVMPYCSSKNIGILGWGSLAEGFLTDNFSIEALEPNDFRRKHPFSRPENHDRIRKVRAELQRVADRHDANMVDVVLAWEVAHPTLTGAIVGIRNEREAVGMTGWSRVRLTGEEMQGLDETFSK